MHQRARRRTITMLLVLAGWAGEANGQTAARADTFVVLAPGPQYARGGLYRTIAGAHNRDLWTTRIRVPVLDLHRFAGGLTPIEAHTGSQTTSLRFAGRDGRTYQFRSVDKDPTALLSPELQGTGVARVLQDGVSSSHPAAALVASALLAAAGVLHVDQTLAVLPDDPALGEYRADFAGLFGMIEERPDENADEHAAFAGARRVISPTRLFERIDESPDDRVDARAFLVARLMDILMGDRDRHRDQFRWATFDDTAPRLWKPISRDHDEAFVRIDGPILDIVRLYYLPLVKFEAEYPRHDQLNWHSREVDRRFLVELDRGTWDSVATALQRTLTDSVLEDAVRRMPPEMVAVDGERLLSILRIRRDHLRDEALSYYAFLSKEVEIRATDAPEIATVSLVDDHHVDIAIRVRDDERPYFHRTFDDAETREIRLKLMGRDDHVLVRGMTRPRIRLRILGGRGDDEFVDSTRAWVRYYDDHGSDTVRALQHRRIDTKPYTEWVGNDLDRYPPREWGTWWRPLPWVTANSDLGVFIGAGVLRTEYGFRRAPFASDIRARIGYATGARALRADLDAELHPENTSATWRLHALASGIEVLRFSGLGNDSPEFADPDYDRVAQQQYVLEPALVLPLGVHTEVALGASARWAHTGENDGRYIATLRDTLYGGRDFGQVGARVAFDVDTRDRPRNATRGVHLSGEARVMPPLLDVTETFGTIEGMAAAFVSAPVPLSPTLAARAGGRRVFGRFPFHEAAFLGGFETLRGFSRQRFAGDASLYGSAELRIALGRTSIAVPTLWGLFGNADAGQVRLDGAAPGGWHTGFGGGLWAGVLGRANTAILGLTRSDEGTRIYASAGFPF